MSYPRVLAKTWAENILFSALLELTSRCNLNCFFCYNDLNLKGVPLSKEEYFRFFEDLRDMQVLNLSLSGGEPLAHPDFFALGAKARELGFVVRIKSNGHAIRGALARRIKEEIDPFIIETSLHGARPETHDRQTRVPGSFQRLMTNLDEMAALGLRVKLNSTLTAWNEDELEEMLSLADSRGLRLNIDPEVKPRDDGDTEPLSIGASREALMRLFRLQAERVAAAQRSGAEGPGATTNREGDELVSPPVSVEKHCGAGSTAIAVDPYGNVYPCVQWRRSVGNLHEKSIKEIWFGSADLDDIRQLTVEAKQMVDGHGPAGKLMRFCPGLAELKTGNPLGLYGEAKTTMTIQQQVLEQTKRQALPVIS